MNRIIINLAFLLIGTSVFAQGNKIAEGTITYTVEWKLPEQMKAMAGSFPSELKVYFKGDSSSLKSESAMFSSTNILNFNKEYERLLLNIPMMNKKFSVIFSPADQERIAANMPELSIKAGTETKKLAGYTVLKHEVTEKKSDQSFEVWFTREVDITPNPLSRFYGKEYGFPVEFTSFMNGMSLKAKVKELSVGTVPTGSFSAGKEYEEISLDQLMQMQGGR